jgi:hypothetical protein
MNEIFRRQANTDESNKFFGDDNKLIRSFSDVPIGNANIDFSKSVSDYMKRIENMSLPKRSGQDGQLFINAPPRVMVVMGKWYRIGFIEKTTKKILEFYSGKTYDDGTIVEDGDIRSAEMSIDMILAYGRSAPENRFVKVEVNGK